MSGHEKRKAALRQYLVFRVKAMEYLDIGALRQQLKNGSCVPPTPVGRRGSDFAESLRTVQLSWFALFIDKSGMNVIPLWTELFPEHRKEIEETWRKIEPTWSVLRTFRNRAGFHADKPIQFFGARREIVRQAAEVAEAIRNFEKLFRTLLHAEAQELPDLPQALDELLDELDTDSPSHKINRKTMKAYLMVS